MPTKRKKAVPIRNAAAPDGTPAPSRAKVARTAAAATGGGTSSTSRMSGAAANKKSSASVPVAAATKRKEAAPAPAAPPKSKAAPHLGRAPAPVAAPSSPQKRPAAGAPPPASLSQHAPPTGLGYKQYPPPPPPYSQIARTYPSLSQIAAGHIPHPSLPSPSSMKPPPAVQRKRAATASATAKKKSFPTLSGGPPLPPPGGPISYSLGGEHSQHGHPQYHPHLHPPNNENSQHTSFSYESQQSTHPPRREVMTTNAIDEVINEVNHLLQAASESQALGRLRNSYSSLLLAHQRLVGVGRRVDRSFCEAEDPIIGSGGDGGGEPNNEESNLSMTSTTSCSSRVPVFHPPLVSQPPLPPTLTQNYTDVAYVEHLAKSGMELHHKRTGRGMQHEAAIERAAHTARVKKMEEEQIHRAAAGVFALATGLTGESAGAGGEGGEDSRSPSKRKGGRGKKPPTLVMHTMAGRNLDVRELMRGIL